MSAQSTSSLLMVRPLTFGFDQETAVSNVFQHQPSISKDEVRLRANWEFDEAVKILCNNHIDVVVFDDPSPLEKPDAVFPNNWLSTWPDGHVYLYPMATQSRRVERSEAALEKVKEHFEIRKVTDFTHEEDKERYLESTGVMIFDHRAQIVYGCRSIRCNEALFLQHAAKLSYTPIIFSALDKNGYPIYHTNVLMGVQTTTAVICLDAITNAHEKTAVVESLQTTGHEIIDITHEQMAAFCGNVLEVRNRWGELFLVMSQSAYNAFTPEQRKSLSQDKKLLALSIPTIETIGGGSVRCMLAEIFLPAR